MKIFKRNFGEKITLVNRKISNSEVKKLGWYEKILNVLEESNEPMTAHEIANKLYKRKLALSNSRQEVAPRLTELCQIGKVDAFGTKHDSYSNRNVTAYVRRYE